MTKILEKIYNFLNHWVIIWVIQPTLVALNLVIVSAYSNTPLQDSIRKCPYIGNALMDSPFTFIFGSVILIYFYRGVLKLLEYLLGYSKKNHIYAIALLESLESVVNKKYKRFVDALNKYGVTSPQKRIVFNDITQPDIQIDALMESLVNCIKTLNTANNDANLRVTLFKISDSKPNKDIYNFPYDIPVRTAIGEFADPQSTVSISIQSKKIVVIEDTKKSCRSQKMSENMFKEKHLLVKLIR